MKSLYRSLISTPYKRWTGLYFLGIITVLVWDILFLNRPAFRLVVSGFFNTFFISFLVVFQTLLCGWVTALILNLFDRAGWRNKVYLILLFLLNLLRSIPQIVGVLLGAIFITYLSKNNVITGYFLHCLLMSSVLSLFIFLEMADLIRDRINHFKALDFFDSMRVAGIRENRIINFDILWKNARVHIFNKMISILGISVFLQCSVDFIISVGLATNVSVSELPITLGSLLAKIDSKQDILAIGHTLTHPFYFPELFFKHLQGITVAFLITFTLLSIHKIASGYAQRHRI